jgi:hypothetical protein
MNNNLAPPTNPTPDDTPSTVSTKQGKQTPSSVYAKLIDLHFDSDMILVLKSLKYAEFSKMHRQVSGLTTNKTGDTFLKIGADGAITQPPDRKSKNHTLGRAIWLSVFNIWVRLTSQYFPELAEDLQLYRETLSMLEQRFSMTFPNGYMIYDHRFRKAVEAMMVANERHETHYIPDFGTLDVQLMESTFLGRTPSSCVNCGATNHTTEECTPLLESVARASIGKASVQDSAITSSTCYAYNKMFGGKGCEKQPCFHSHTCNNCRGDHPVVECPSRQQQDNTSKKQNPKQD